tara:strand:- start:2881 stop:3375 length:495 start_codon:yes stop_codon:yes gene_type:complete
MSKGEFISESGFTTLDNGRHLTKLTNIADDLSDAGYDQMVGTFTKVDADGNEPSDPKLRGSIRKWWNLEGFEKEADGKTYKLDKDGNRIHSDENTAACGRIIGQFANRCGIPAGESFNRKDLFNKVIGIVVKPNKISGSPEVTNFVAFDKMAAKLAVVESGYAG